MSPSTLPSHGRFDYSAITQRGGYAFPGSARLAVYIGFNVEHFAFGEGLGAALVPDVLQPDVPNYAWREYGNRVGAWRCIDLFEDLHVPVGAIVNAAIYDHCPELAAALAARGDEIIAHGYSNAFRQGAMEEAEERRLLAACRDRIEAETGRKPRGWLSPWISETYSTPDLLAECGYTYTLDWCHDDQPTRFRTRNGALLSIPYPQELNDIPAMVARKMEAPAFADMIIDNFEEMRRQSTSQPLVMGIALHPYIVGQPYRLRHLRRALGHIAGAREVWFTTPGAIAEYAGPLLSCRTQPGGGSPCIAHSQP